MVIATYANHVVVENFKPRGALSTLLLVGCILWMMPFRITTIEVEIMNITKNPTRAVLSLLLLVPVWGFADSVPDDTFRKVAEEFEVPAVVLYAVACVESAKHSTTEANKPWPWTLTIAGERRHYPTREAAQADLDNVLELGISNIGVGLMQINWRRYHGLLGDPSRALDPVYNLRIGASILRDQWNREDDLWLAIGQYHSMSPADGGAFKYHVGAEVVRLLSQQTRFDAPNG